jgi:hypothetical protein
LYIPPQNLLSIRPIYGDPIWQTHGHQNFVVILYVKHGWEEAFLGGLRIVYGLTHPIIEHHLFLVLGFNVDAREPHDV